MDVSIYYGDPLRCDYKYEKAKVEDELFNRDKEVLYLVIVDVKIGIDYDAYVGEYIPRQ